MTDADYMRLALRLARRGRGRTSPNPMVGAVVVQGGVILGRGWHHRAGEPHAEILALRAAVRRHGRALTAATLYVTLEPCCTTGRTPPCTDAILAAGIRRVVAGATDPNPRHAGRGFEMLQQAGLTVVTGVLGEECAQLNEAFNHWIVHGTPLVTVKAAMTLDGKIATATGESRWITGERARAEGMKLRQASDAILVGINTVLADDPALTWRPAGAVVRTVLPATNVAAAAAGGSVSRPPLRRIILDARARTPLTARVVTDEYARWTTIVVGEHAPGRRVAALAKQANVLALPATGAPRPALDLRRLLQRLGAEGVTSLLVEGGGEVQAAFLADGLAQRAAFFYAPKILGGRDARKAVAGAGARSWREVVPLTALRWRRLGPDLWLTARVG